MFVGRALCGLALLTLTGCAATEPEPQVEVVDVTPTSFPLPPSAVAATAIPTPEDTTAIFRTVFDGTAERGDRADALEGSPEENAAVFDSGGIVSEVVFDHVSTVSPDRVEATGASLGQPTTVDFVVSDGRWKLERSTACAVTGAC
ncbi:MAG: hypothetical protein V7694_18790 [Rhodococcus sp. (in: high G+C Gram-positive bacteria)]